MKLNPWAGVVAALMVMLCACVSVVEGEEMKRSTHLYGMNAGAVVWDGKVLLTKAKAKAMAEAGVRSVRINFRLDGKERWTPGLLKMYDKVVRNARSAGMEILGVWSNETTYGGQWWWNEVGKGERNDYVKKFAQNASMLAGRYRKVIKTWEVWNEPGAWTEADFRDDPQHAGGTYILPGVWAEMLVETELALRQSRRGDLIMKEGLRLVTGGLFAHDLGGGRKTGAAYLREVYEQADTWERYRTAIMKMYGEGSERWYPWDVVGYHFYIDQSGALDEEKLRFYFKEVIDVLRAYEDKSKLLVTEFGWQTQGNSERVQAENMQIAYAVLEEEDSVTEVYWYQWQDEPDHQWGITTRDGKKKASYTIFREDGAAGVDGL
ncbi:hypothetical protein [Poriferisphaera sp. WC338]|uniref:hypothetical protein n=1 Tax=Poriferisphaera sp. WC338 TaxID=3425129 RepID=UPI003D81A884